MPEHFPAVQDDDPDEVADQLAMGSAMWARGEREDALIRLRRAAQAAAEGDLDRRALVLAKAASGLAVTLGNERLLAPGAPQSIPPARPAAVAAPALVCSNGHLAAESGFCGTCGAVVAANGTPNYLERNSDGDLLADGKEDKNGNCIVDADETDRTKADTNGDGVSDLVEVTLLGVVAPVTQDAVARYQEMYAEFAADGVIEDWEKNELLEARKELGITEATHAAIAAKFTVRGEVLPITLDIDANTISMLTAGEPGTLRARVSNGSPRAIRNVVVRHAIVGKAGILERAIRIVPPGQSDVLAIGLEASGAGQFALHTAVRVEDMMGRPTYFRGEPFPYAVAKRASGGPQTVVTHIDASSMRVGDLSGMHLGAGPSSRGAVLEAAKWAAVALRTISDAEWLEWEGAHDGGKRHAAEQLAQSERQRHDREQADLRARSEADQTRAREAAARERAETERRAREAAEADRAYREAQAASVQMKAEADRQAQLAALRSQHQEAERQARAVDEEQRRLDADRRARAQARARGEFLRVALDGTGDVRRPSEAVERIAVGGVVEIAQGQYDDAFVIRKKMTLRAEPGAHVVIVPPGAGHPRRVAIEARTGELTAAAAAAQQAEDAGVDGPELVSAGLPDEGATSGIVIMVLVLVSFIGYAIWNIGFSPFTIWATVGGTIAALVGFAIFVVLSALMFQLRMFRGQVTRTANTLTLAAYFTTAALSPFLLAFFWVSVSGVGASLAGSLALPCLPILVYQVGKLASVLFGGARWSSLADARNDLKEASRKAQAALENFRNSSSAAAIMTVRADAAIEAVTFELGDRPGFFSCPRCMAPMPSDAGFCAECGAPLGRAVHPNPTASSADHVEIAIDITGDVDVTLTGVSILAPKCTVALQLSGARLHVHLDQVEIIGGEHGIVLRDGRVSARGIRVSGAKSYGLWSGGARFDLEDSTVERCGVGMKIAKGVASVERSQVNECVGFGIWWASADKGGRFEDIWTNKNGAFGFAKANGLENNYTNIRHTNSNARELPASLNPKDP